MKTSLKNFRQPLPVDSSFPQRIRSSHKYPPQLRLYSFPKSKTLVKDINVHGVIIRECTISSVKELSKKFAFSKSCKYLRKLKGSSLPINLPSAQKQKTFAFLRKLNRIRKLELFIDVNVYNHGRHVVLFDISADLLKHLRSYTFEKLKIKIKSVQRSKHYIKAEGSDHNPPDLKKYSLIGRLVRLLAHTNNLRNLSISHADFPMDTPEIQVPLLNHKDQKMISMFITKITRMKKLNSLSLLYTHFLTSLGQCFYLSVADLPSLKKLKVLFPNSSLTPALASILKNIKELKSITILGHFDVSLLASIIISQKSLANVSITRFWSHKKDIKEVQLSKYQYSFNRVESLNLDACINIENLQEQDFYLSFLLLFEHVKSLKLHIKYSSLIKFVEFLGEILGGFTNLTELTLKIDFYSAYSMGKFFQEISNISSLQKITFVIQVPYDHVWDQKGIATAFSGFRNFLKNQGGLKNLQIYWNQISLLSMEQLVSCLLPIKHLDVLRLEYTTKKYRHSDLHTKILASIEKLISKVTSVEQLKIKTICGFIEKGHAGSCSDKAPKLRKLKQKNSNIGILNFVCFAYNFRMSTPFSNTFLTSS